MLRPSKAADAGSSPAPMQGTQVQEPASTPAGGLFRLGLMIADLSCCKFASVGGPSLRHRSARRRRSAGRLTCSAAPLVVRTDSIQRSVVGAYWVSVWVRVHSPYPYRSHLVTSQE